MSIDFSLLDSSAKVLFTELIDKCASQNITMVPFNGFRTLQEQAKLWRQSRPLVEITDQIRKLRTADCDYLADIIEEVGPCNGRWATNAIPGLSWHNWGEAMDCMRIINARAEWDKVSVYDDYGAIAKSIGLRWGGDFSTPDSMHVQVNQKEISSMYMIKYINDHFRDKAQT